MYFFYSALLALGLLLLSPYFVFQGLRHKKYFHNLGQRLGWLPEAVRRVAPGGMWVHAVSVGEVLAVVPLVRQLRQRFPERPLLLTTVTLTGQHIAARQQLADAVFYFPFDFALACRRALAHLRPALVVVAETEIWPNFLREAKRAGVPVGFVNGRISERSFRGHRRFPLWHRFLRCVLCTPAFFLMQSEHDAERIIALGAPATRVAIGGNLKFDVSVPARPAFLAALEARVPVIVGGSTLEGEEAMLVDCLRGLKRDFPGALLVLAPRHPERFDPVARWLEARRVPFVRRSALRTPGDNHFFEANRPDVLLLDTLGELAGTYAAATVAFVGGSLVPAGGHNPVEPGLWGKPILFGPSMENFRLMARAFESAGAAVQVRDSRELGTRLAELLGDAERRRAMGRAAAALVASSRGATARAVEKVAQLLAAPG
ncbi:MAG: 3-deoxy-D-manno-octulosonic acid transferase [Terriglobia bacterium]